MCIRDRLDRDHSVTIRGCEWFDHDSRQGGNAISFVRWFYNYSYPEAVKALLGGEQGTIYPSAAEREKSPQKPFELPEANTNMRRIFAYLMKHRHIDRDVIAYFAKAKTLFEDSKYHNCVFVGTDEQGIPRHAHKRSANSFGKSFRQNVEGSDPKYSFHHLGTCLLYTSIYWSRAGGMMVVSLMIQTRLLPSTVLSWPSTSHSFVTSSVSIRTSMSPTLTLWS